MDHPSRILAPPISLRDLLEALRTLLKRADWTPLQREEITRVVDPWEDDPQIGDIDFSESQRSDSANTALVRTDSRLADAAVTALEVSSRLIALRVPPLVAIASGLLAGSLALLTTDNIPSPS